jgi:hypothetical protein
MKNKKRDLSIDIISIQAKSQGLLRLPEKMGRKIFVKK